MTFGIYDCLIPAEPIVRGMPEPRLVSFTRADDHMLGRALNKKEQEAQLTYRVTQVKNAMVKIKKEWVTCRDVSTKTGMNIAHVSRTMQFMKKNGMLLRDDTLTSPILWKLK